MFKYSLKLEQIKSSGIFRRLQELFNRIEWKAAVQIGIASAISLFLGLSFSTLFNRPDTLVSGVWTVVSTIVVLQAQLGGTYKAAWQRFLGVLIGTVVGCIFTEWLGSSPLYVGISVACTVLVCTLINIKDSVRIACLSAAVVMILWGIRPQIDPWVFGIFRFLDSCIGILVAMVVAHTVWPSHATQKMQSNISKILKALGHLFEHAVDFEKISDKANLLLENEISDLLKQSNNYLEEAKLELLTRYSSLEDWKLLIKSLESIYESVVTLQQLPKSKLAFIFDEPLMKNFSNLTDKIDVAFQDLARQMEVSRSTEFTTAIENELFDGIKSLKEDLLRFRETKTTRKFELMDVETFFVFFYSLGTITDELLRVREIIPKIN